MVAGIVVGLVLGPSGTTRSRIAFCGHVLAVGKLEYAPGSERQLLQELKRTQSEVDALASTAPATIQPTVQNFAADINGIIAANDLRALTLDLQSLARDDTRINAYCGISNSGGFLPTSGGTGSTGGTGNTGSTGEFGSAQAACEADAKSIETALEAYKAVNGSYPVPPLPWSSGTYVEDFSPLTSGANKGPYLKAPPNTYQYVIEYDSSGHVWVEGANVFDTKYNPTTDFYTNPNVCNNL